MHAATLLSMHQVHDLGAAPVNRIRVLGAAQVIPRRRAVQVAHPGLGWATRA
eukprot:CAMPEP_0170652064 /NCGR_PEP_ID=MMETSP0224-20130122/46707_1 /TAXON_ID=285029 /ORGANISM="Togula jolla, Strain CCCM 725" /LENGTH=51 /DNA_ID=CAMNT_0010983909 /DNA_START=231 /DNA_END=386 /DNA_ORIENTATION=-